MSKTNYFFKLIPPRATFPGDITPEESALMDEHAEYLRKEFEAGRALIYGPVFRPDGAFGMTVREVADEAEARAFAEKDPSVRAGMNRWEIYPMRVVGARANA